MARSAQAEIGVPAHVERDDSMSQTRQAMAQPGEPRPRVGDGQGCRAQLCQQLRQPPPTCAAQRPIQPGKAGRICKGQGLGQGRAQGGPALGQPCCAVVLGKRIPPGTASGRPQIEQARCMDRVIGPICRAMQPVAGLVQRAAAQRARQHGSPGGHGPSGCSIRPLRAHASSAPLRLNTSRKWSPSERKPRRPRRRYSQRASLSGAWGKRAAR